MPLFFLDTSALVKYYRDEVGSQFVQQLFAEPGAQRIISWLTLVEIESAFCIKVRMGEIEKDAASTARLRLESDLGRRLIIVAAVRDEHFRLAKRLVIKYGSDHGLRTLDALQLSVAKNLKRAGFAPTFVAADLRLCRTAQLEGFQVANPEESLPNLA